MPSAALLAVDNARGLLTEVGEITAPDLIDAETATVLRKRWLSNTMSLPRLQTAIADLQAWDFDRVPTRPLLAGAYQLRNNVSAYDAMYVLLAAALGCELYTADKRLAGAPNLPCRIRLIS